MVGDETANRPNDFAIDVQEEGATKGEGVEKEQAEDASDAAAIDEPFDPTKIRISTRQPTVSLVVNRMRLEEINLQPDFQRSGNIWTRPMQSRLIESMLLRIPLPVFYMAADHDDNWQVVDGLQRLSAVRAFVLEETLQLQGLEYLSQFDALSFAELPRPMQRRITETQLSCHIIEPGTPPEVMFNIFKRINTGGKPLVAQEIRHALNPGPARDLLGELAQSEEFLKATDNSVSDKRMADRECVLRFLAFRLLGVTRHEGKLDDFLMSAMKSLNNAQQEHVSSLKADFRRAMSLAFDIFGQEAFRKPSRLGKVQSRNPVNKALFESLSVALAEVPEGYAEELKSQKDRIVECLAQLMEDPEFFESISTGTHTTKKVNIRFGRTRDVVQQVLA